MLAKWKGCNYLDSLYFCKIDLLCEVNLAMVYQVAVMLVKW